jgi:arabinogalactan oligomer/maltooligosaccharide transport system substrate-binding protein
MKTMKFLASILLMTFLVSCGLGANPNQITIWTQEGEADGAFQYVQGLTDDFKALKAETVPGIDFEVENRETETLREDFATASLTNSAPDLVWTVSDHAGPFVNADIILALEDEIDTSKYLDSVLEAVTLDGSIWGVPVNNGNHLMMMYNKELIAEPPTTTDELIEVGKELTKGERFGLVFNQVEPFWLVPWLGGFGGTVFAEDGTTGTLNTPEMVDTLQFLYDLKFVHGILPKESDYNGADTMFKEGKAAMIINGDWILGEYLNLMGDKLGVARIPMVSETGIWPAPYTSGKFMMLSKELQDKPEKKALVLEFADFATNLKNQQDLVYYLTRLPSIKEAYESDLIDDPMINDILLSSAEQMDVGTPMPSVPEMRFNWDAMRPWMSKVLNQSATPREAALGMQTDMETIRASRN